MPIDTTQNFYALCKGEEGVEIKRLKTRADLQMELQGVFNQQHTYFIEGITAEESFVGDWNPEADELATIPVSELEEYTAIKEAILGNTTSLDELEDDSFEEANVKAIFTGYPSGDGVKVFMQLFTRGQILSRKLAVVFEQQVFRKLENPGFLIDNKLLCVIEGDVVKFKSFFNMKKVFNLNDLYKEATNEDIADFAENEKLSISDLDNFKDEATQEIRKLVHKVMKSGVLDNYTAQEIKDSAATSVGLTINVNGDGKIVFPDDRREIIDLLSYLNDGLYKAGLSGKMYRAKGKRERDAA